MRPPESRSPLQMPPRPLPGQSVHNSIVDLVFVRLLAPLWIASTLSVIAILESLATLGHWRRAPGIYAALAGIAAGFCALQFWSNRREIKQRQQGRDGERLVAESLDELRALGASVFHDVPAPGFNLDHVVLSTRGFFVIETKTWTKPERGRPHITFAHDSILFGGQAPQRNPVEQVQAEAGWLRKLLEQSTGRPAFPIKGALVFPGLKIQSMTTAWKRSPHLPWVLPPTGLKRFMEFEPARISPEDVSLAALHLDRYVRSEQAKRAERA